jgi:hypothetical protein
VPPTALTRAKPKILAVHRWLALVAGLFLMSQGLTIMAISGYILWIMRTLRRRNSRSAEPVLGGR